MGLGFFFVGGIIFAVYIYFTIWNIFHSSKKQREENYPSHDPHDYDGIGNQGRFPNKKEK